MSWLINAAQLDKFRKSQKNVVILDTSWHLPAANRNAREEFLTSHVSGARFLDLNEFHDHETVLANMLTRDENKINQLVGALGITNEHKIIFYDKSDLHTSCRALWMFKVFGHNPNQLYILDGGYAAWEKYGGKAETGEVRNAAAKSYTASYQAHFVRTLMQMKTNIHHPAEQVVDVRHPVRYAGGPETRVGMRPGHIPGSFCFPYFTMFEADGRFKPMEKIRRQLMGTGVSLDYPIISTCGSGITSAILNFMLELMNQNNNALYDGSWTEWGSDQLYPGESSLAERPVITSLD
jgi:thiosulfate/3-mercaptopyruvate sulfurtransferase